MEQVLFKNWTEIRQWYSKYRLSHRISVVTVTEQLPWVEK